MGKPRNQYIIGNKYGRENVILLEILSFESNGRTKGKFRCTCNNEFIARITSVTSGNTIGCGCREKNHMITHGLSSDSIYHTYTNIISKCYNKNNPKYKYYGERGIVMSDEFKDNPKIFIKYIISLPNYDKRLELNLTLDRIENNGIYERGNLRWATTSEQMKNRRKWSKTPIQILIVD